MTTYRDYGIEIPYGRTSGHIKTFCPQCRDKRSNKSDKSLSVDLSNGLWKCHYCGFAGCLPKNNPNYHNGSKSAYKQEYRIPKGTGNPSLSVKALGYFASRGISLQTVTSMRITEGLEFMPQKGKEVNTIQFNYYKGGQLVNTKFRTADKCFKLVPGAELILYNLDAIKGTPECIITEGEMDALSFIEIGRTDVVSVPNGANANLQYLDDYIDEYFEDKETIYIASDTDTKGVVLREELLRRFGPERCKIVGYGEDCKDANEHLQKYGKESLFLCLANAVEPKIEGIFTVSDFEQSLDLLFERGMQRGVTIGHENFDNFCSFETKRLLIITGIPGSGKSEWIDEIAERLNIRYDWRFAFFSPENAPLQYHASKLIEKFTGKKFEKGSLPYGEYQQVKQHLEQNFFFISPNDDFRLETILSRAKSLVHKKGIKALVIDPYNRLENEQDSRRSETQHISAVLDRLTNFAQQNDVLVILMAHPVKMPKNKDGKIEVPTLYDISGSANFFNKADFGITVHRDRELNVTEVHIQKVKFKHLGEVGVAMFKYNLHNGRYAPYEENSEVIWDNSNHLVDKALTLSKEAEKQAVLDFENDDFDNDLPF